MGMKTQVTCDNAKCGKEITPVGEGTVRIQIPQMNVEYHGDAEAHFAYPVVDIDFCSIKCAGEGITKILKDDEKEAKARLAVVISERIDARETARERERLREAQPTPTAGEERGTNQPSEREIREQKGEVTEDDILDEERFDR